jgi:hypothetical protein
LGEAPKAKKKKKASERMTPHTSMPKGVFAEREEGAPKQRAVFNDAEAMKQKVREALISPQYNVFDDYHYDGICQRIAKSKLFDTATLTVIFLNTVWIGVDGPQSSCGTGLCSSSLPGCGESILLLLRL